MAEQGDHSMVTSNTPHGGSGTGGAGRNDGRSETEKLTEAARREAAGIGEAAKDRARDFADEKRHAGSEAVQSVADAARSAAEDLERTSPELARYTREAASAVDRFS
jgi:F0F1-type ATP synthase membrane subunit b/b'